VTGTGFYIDDRDGRQDLIVIDALNWCDKRGSRWQWSTAESPPPKSKLLAKDPNFMTRFVCGENTKRGCDFDFELNWRKP
jgi:hypothetical protein